MSVKAPITLDSTSASVVTGSARATRKMPQDASVPSWLSSRTLRRPTRSDQRPSTGAPTSWKAEYVAPMIPYTTALPPSRVTRKTRNGRTMLKPSAPTKLTARIG